MLGRKSEILETRRTVGSAAASEGGAADGDSLAAALAAVEGEVDGAVAWQAANTNANTATIAGKRARI
jgi:hypothetical protein